MAARKAKKRGKAKAKAAPAARVPSVVSPHMDALCEWVAHGGTLVDYCQVHGLSTRTVNYHLHRNADAAAAYARAREAQADAIAADMLRLADDCTEDDVQSTRTKIDTRKWLLARWHRKTYGDHQKVEHEGGMQINVVTGVPQSKNLEQVANREGIDVERDE